MFTNDNKAIETPVAATETAKREIDISETEAFMEAFLSGDKDVIFVI